MSYIDLIISLIPIFVFNLMIGSFLSQAKEVVNQRRKKKKRSHLKI